MPTSHQYRAPDSVFLADAAAFSGELGRSTCVHLVRNNYLWGNCPGGGLCVWHSDTGFIEGGPRRKIACHSSVSEIEDEVETPELEGGEEFAPPAGLWDEDTRTVSVGGRVECLD